MSSISSTNQEEPESILNRLPEVLDEFNKSQSYPEIERLNLDYDNDNCSSATASDIICHMHTNGKMRNSAGHEMGDLGNDEDDHLEAEHNVTGNKEQRLKMLSELFHERCSLLYHDIMDVLNECMDTNTDSDSACSTANNSPRDQLSMLINQRYEKLLNQSIILRQLAPEMDSEIDYRMQLLDKIIKQINNNPLIIEQISSDTATDSEKTKGIPSTGSPINDLRFWLGCVEEKLTQIECHDLDIVQIRLLQKLKISQKEIQTSIETDGKRLVRKSTPKSESSNPQQVALPQQRRIDRLHSTLVNRWHCNWLRSLELAFRLDQQLQLHKAGLRVLSSLSNSREKGPAPKRRRLSALDSTDNQSESINTSCQSINDLLNNKQLDLKPEEWSAMSAQNMDENILEDNLIEYRNAEGNVVKAVDDSQQNEVVVLPDVGYSSGENSLHEGCTAMQGLGASPEKTTTQGKEISPVKVYYKMTPLDDLGLTDTETPRSCEGFDLDETLLITEKNDQLTESMCVNVGDASTINVLNNNTMDEHTELEEVLDLLEGASSNNQRSVPNGDVMSKSLFGAELERLLEECQPDSNQGTTWKEFTGRKDGNMKMSRSCMEQIQDSCDASSEQSDQDQSDMHHLQGPDSPQPHHNMSTPSPPNGCSKATLKRPQTTPRRNGSNQLIRPRDLMTQSVTSSLLRGKNCQKSVLSSLLSQSMYQTNTSTTNNSLTSTPSIVNSTPKHAHKHLTINPNVHNSANNNSERKRRKLRAKRAVLAMPRSLSDGEHLGKLNYMVNKEAFFNPPVLPSPSGSDVPPDPHGASLTNQHAALSNQTPNQRAADEGQTSEQEDKWQWDDYEPPAHLETTNESDPALDDSHVTDFGDDYRLYLDGRPAPKLDLGDSASDVSTTGDVHHDQDGLEMCQQQLCRAKELVNWLNNTDQHTDQQTIADHATELLSLCESNVTALHSVCVQLLAADSDCSDVDYANITSLLKQWQDIWFTARSLHPIAGNLPSLKHSSGLSSTNDCLTQALQAQMRQFSASLKQLIVEGALQDIDTKAYTSIDDIQEALHMFQNLASRLRSERQGLRLLSKAGVKVPTEIGDELKSLGKCCDQALHTCEQHVDTLLTLKQYWIEYQETAMNLSNLMNKLKDNLGALEFQHLHPGKTIEMEEGDEPKRSGLSIPKLESVHREIRLAEERMNRLDRVCDYLQNACDFDNKSATSDPDSGLWSSESRLQQEDRTHSPDFQGQLQCFKRQLQELNERLTSLPVDNTEKENPSNELRQRTLVHKATNTNIDAKADGLNSLTTSTAAGSAGSSLAGRLWNRVCIQNQPTNRYTWPLRICILVLLCLGLAVIPTLFWASNQNGSNSGPNNWRAKWGPQLDYVRGPPPA